MSEKSSLGVFKSFRIYGVKIIPAATTKKEMMRPMARVVESSFFRSSYLLAPNCLLMSTPAPMHIPDMERIMMLFTGADIPIAASASLPMKRPAIMLSAAL